MTSNCKKLFYWIVKFQKVFQKYRPQKNTIRIFEKHNDETETGHAIAAQLLKNVIALK